MRCSELSTHPCHSARVAPHNVWLKQFHQCRHVGFPPASAATAAACCVPWIVRHFWSSTAHLGARDRRWDAGAPTAEAPGLLRVLLLLLLLLLLLQLQLRGATLRGAQAADGRAD
jgi:hypothetical protein